MVIAVVTDSAARVIAKGGSNYSLINRLVGASWSLAASDSLSILLWGVSSSSGAADAPCRGRPPPVRISSERPLTSREKLQILPPS